MTVTAEAPQGADPSGPAPGRQPRGAGPRQSGRPPSAQFELVGEFLKPNRAPFIATARPSAASVGLTTGVLSRIYKLASRAHEAGVRKALLQGIGWRRRQNAGSLQAAFRTQHSHRAIVLRAEPPCSVDTANVEALIDIESRPSLCGATILVATCSREYAAGAQSMTRLRYG
jgi:hypothetical protein